MKLIQPPPKGRTLYIKIKDENPSIKSTRQMRAQVDITQMKNKSKQKIRKKSYANRTHGHEMMINDNNANLRQKNRHLPQIGCHGGALVMMCGRDEEPKPSAIAH
jgi:hypothetical protein